jgi:hypothetical protein
VTEPARVGPTGGRVAGSALPVSAEPQRTETQMNRGSP